MPRRCAVPLCKKIRGSPKYRHVTFHRFPRDPLRRKEWCMKIQIQDMPDYDLYNVCSDHFGALDYVKLASGIKKLRSDSVPSRRLPPEGFRLQNLEPEMVVVDADPLPLVNCFGDGVSALDDPKVYQLMMLADDVPNRSAPVNNVSQPCPVNSVSKPSQNFVIKVLKFLTPPPVRKILPKEEVPLCDLKSELKNEKISPKDESALSGLKPELLAPPPIRSPLTTMNDLVSVIQYDHSYAMPYGDNLVHGAPVGANYPVNENGQYDQSLFCNEVGTMTELSGQEWDKLFEFEREIRWLWQRNQKMQDVMSNLLVRNRELVHNNLRTRKELLQKSEMLSKMKKQIEKLKLKHPELEIEVD